MGGRMQPGLILMLLYGGLIDIGHHIVAVLYVTGLALGFYAGLLYELDKHEGR